MMSQSEFCIFLAIIFVSCFTSCSATPCKTDDDCFKFGNNSFCATNNQTCQCKANFTSSKEYSICVKPSLIDLLDKHRKIGETCIDILSIPVDSNSHCVNGTIQCKRNFTLVIENGRKICRGTVKLGFYCQHYRDCADKYADCSIEYVCQCKYQYEMVNNTCMRKADTVGAKCGPLRKVTLKYAECKNGVVVCKSGYHPGFRYCVNDKGAAVGEPCSQLSDCTKITVGSHCFINKCMCKSLFGTVKTIDGKPTCIVSVGVGEACDGKYTTCSGSGADCKDGTCECKSSYYVSMGICLINSSLVSLYVKCALYGLGAVIALIAIGASYCMYRRRLARRNGLLRNATTAPKNMKSPLSY